MTIGQVVDFVITYNERNTQADNKKETGTRKATQKDIDAFFG